MTNEDTMTETKRRIHTHEDGHGFQERIEVRSDEPAEHGPAYAYEVRQDITKTAYGVHVTNSPGYASEVVARVQFQRGAPGAVDSTPGCTESALLAILIDRAEGHQRGPFACAENEAVLGHLRAALALQKQRADERAARGVLGRSRP